MFDFANGIPAVMQTAVANILRAQRPDLPEEIDALFAVVRHYSAQLDAIKAQLDHVANILERDTHGNPRPELVGAVNGADGAAAPRPGNREPEPAGESGRPA